MTAPRYEVVIVDRQPQASGPPNFVQVEAINGVRNISWHRKLSAADQASLGFPARIQAASIKTRLMELDNFPIEMWVYREGVLVFAGPVYGTQIQGPTVTLNSPGLAGYFDRWFVEPGDTLTYNAVDQFTIAKGLVDYWQGLEYGDFGIDTSGITTSGVTRDRLYDGDKPHIIGQRLSELANVQNGFEWVVTPDRQLVLGYPTLGTDKTASVIVDHRSIASASGIWSVGPRDLTTEGYVWAEEATATSSNTTLRATWGRVGFGVTEASATEQDTLDGKAEAITTALSSHLHVPSPVVMVRGDVSVEGIDVGDLIHIEYDYGLGEYQADHRLGGFRVQTDERGQEKITLELL